MSRKRFRCVVGAAVALTLSMAAAKQPALAQSPEPVLRTFGVFINDLGPHDFLDEDSVAVTVLPEVTHHSNLFNIRFVSSGTDDYVDYDPPYNEVDDERLDGTTWYLYPAMHTVKGDKVGEDFFFWLHDDGTAEDPPLGAQPDLPPIGSHTFTGPDGLIVSEIRCMWAFPCPAIGGSCPRSLGCLLERTS